MAEAYGAALRLVLLSADLFNERAIFRGSFRTSGTTMPGINRLSEIASFLMTSFSFESRGLTCISITGSSIPLGREAFGIFCPDCFRAQ